MVSFIFPASGRVFKRLNGDHFQMGEAALLPFGRAQRSQRFSHGDESGWAARGALAPCGDHANHPVLPSARPRITGMAAPSLRPCLPFQVSVHSTAHLFKALHAKVSMHLILWLWTEEEQVCIRRPFNSRKQTNRPSHARTCVQVSTYIICHSLH